MNHHDHCLLCGSFEGIIIQCTASSTLDMIRERTLKGPVAYAAVMEWTSPILPVCRPCLQQLRRLKPNFYRRKKNRNVPLKKQFLPLDAILLQTLVPGLTRHYDLRTRMRMRRALSLPGNLYSRLFEAIPHVLPPASETEPPVAATLTKWWEYNLMTEFFAHKSCARLLRVIGSSTPTTGLMSSTPCDE